VVGKQGHREILDYCQHPGAFDAGHVKDPLIVRNKEFFKNKKITIVGLARSGKASADLLSELGAQVSVTDNQDSESVRLFAAQLEPKNIKIELGRHSRRFIEGRDMIVVSPGVPDKALPLSWARALNIPVISEIELAASLCPATIIAVTGSNGKTTVTTLIGEILAASKRQVFVCGNIGQPFCSELKKMHPGDFVALEVSSFQLETTKDFKPKVSLILNISANHLDRYLNIEEYIRAKKRIYLNQDKSDYAVLNREDPLVRSLDQEIKAQVVYFSKTKDLNPNQAAVLAVGKILAIDQRVCQEVFAGFKGLAHRQEYVTEINKIKFVNDSKATTAESALWALKNISQPVILIAGGRHKGIDYGIILKEAKDKVKKAILIGEAKEKIKEALGESFPVEDAATLEEAVSKAFQSACAGDCVLLSPMCSSYDMFHDYEERGRVFKEVVLELAESKRGKK
jgi:UDP-N-acetylmuramoylalanine--D-glutamate ligase